MRDVGLRLVVVVVGDQYLVSCYRSLARLALDTGDTSLAVEHCREARAILDTLATKDPQNVEFKADLALLQQELGAALLEAGHLDDAQDSLESARELLEGLFEALPEIAALGDGLTRAYANLAVLLKERGDRRAGEYARKALRLIEDGYGGAEADELKAELQVVLE